MEKVQTDIDGYIISINSTISHAAERLDAILYKCIYVVDYGGCLIGSVTDGDIRRGIINNIDFSDSVERIMYKSPHKLYAEDANRGFIADKLKALGIKSIPVVDFDNKITDIIILQEAVFVAEEDSKIIRRDNFVFILAGGEGSRLRPLTNIIPKPLIPIGDNPILEIIMDKFMADGFEKFILSLNFKSDLIKLYFDNPPVKDKYKRIDYVNEEKPLGTIGSLCLAKKHLTEDFVISNADVLIKEDIGRIMDFHKERDAVLTIVGCTKRSVLPYGVLEINEADELMVLEEKPSIKHIVNAGIYVAKPEIISYISDNEYTDMTDVIEILLNSKKRVCVYQIADNRWTDIGHWDELRRTIDYF